jgi:hypothetical protein
MSFMKERREGSRGKTQMICPDLVSVQELEETPCKTNFHDSELVLSPDSEKHETEQRTTGNFKKPTESSMMVSEGNFDDYTIAEIMTKKGETSVGSNGGK